MKRRVKLTIHSLRRRTLAASDIAQSTHCAACGHEVELLSRTQAAGILEVEEPAVDMLLQSGHLHAIETIIGSRKICKDSLFARTGYVKA
jgi:hypothetical protein